MPKRFRPLNSDIHFSRVFDREGIATERRTANLSEQHDASIFLFKQILHPKDPRWRLARSYAEIKRNLPVSPINLENGMRAKYASKSHGKNKEYGASITGILHVLQLARALKNIELGQKHVYGRKEIPTTNPNYHLKFERTKSIEKKSGRHGITGCPEAMWQLQLWTPKGFLGRVGFNFHMENGKTIVTIANVQGASGNADEKKREQNQFMKEMGVNFGEYLTTALQKTLGANFEYRGVLPNGSNPTQYRMTYRKSKPRIKVWSTEIKTMVEDRRKA